ncbi:MAG: carbohydrate kinase [Ferruginibacter sp.]|nr:carbohydrate kinase [Ferruginibacter sp.]
MSEIRVIAIFDVGKTNKKLFLINELYNIVYEKTMQFEEVLDEDGDVCENIEALTTWGKNAIATLIENGGFEIVAINFSAYGASFVYVDDEGKTLTPLYNYLKPYPQELQNKFYNQYGGKTELPMLTASPVLGNLNSGVQLYRLKYMQPAIFKKVKYALHLPQYLSYLITGKAYSDITSIGCHTHLWNFSNNNYHSWVSSESIDKILPPIFSSAEVIVAKAFWKNFKVGVGLHDSSAALIPYLASFSEPFILISTGTWCISLNPFNKQPLTEDELNNDCLCYMSYTGNAVKASRLFAGNEHEIETNRLAKHYNVPKDSYKTIGYDVNIINKLVDSNKLQTQIQFANRDLNNFENYAIAYHRLMLDIMWQQLASTKRVLQNEKVNRLFVDGGFSKNEIYMHLLAEAFPEMEVYASSVAQATAIGAALAIHKHWNTKPLPGNIIELKLYTKPALP